MKKITVYTKSGCPQCDMTKRVLTENDVKFEIKDTDKDKEAYHYIKEELGLSSMPVVIVEGEEPFTGFRPDKLNELID
ncbi:glutaredoxin [Bacillus phage vB_BanS-Thrax5]|nr:glutaredoxin [Bacillus phage vB_BanS-Thrax5]